MEKQARAKLARDLMSGLIRKGWIQAHHAVDMTETLDGLLDENETLRENLAQAAEHRKSEADKQREKTDAWRRNHYQRPGEYEEIFGKDGRKWD